MSKRPPPPDPVAVLRGHRASITDVCFHQTKPILFAGTTGGELRIWDTVQHRTMSSSWVHSVAHGIISVATGPSIGLNKVISNPSLTIKTNSYHFCKLSLVKEPYANAKQTKEPKDCYGREVRETVDADSLCDSRDDVPAEGPKYMAIAGEHFLRSKYGISTLQKDVSNYIKTAVGALQTFHPKEEGCAWQFKHIYLLNHKDS